MPIISIIVAMDKNGLIGADNRVPWGLPEDMKYFREITMGKPVIMGRKTYESIPERFRPLQGRTNIVITRQNDFDAPGCIVTHSTASAIDIAGDVAEIMIIGGADIYRQFLPLVNRIYLTLIDGEFAGDAYFPNLDPGEWMETERDEHSPDAKHSHPFAFLVLERRPEEDASQHVTGDAQENHAVT